MNSKETVILEGEKGFMTVRHLVLAGTNQEIGKKLAEIAIQRYGLVPEMTAANPAYVRRLSDYLAGHYPILRERSRGVADALGLDPADERFDTSGIPYNLGFAPGCSSVYYPASSTGIGHSLLSRNYDFCLISLPEMMGRSPEDRNPKPMMAEPYLIEMHPSDAGYSSLSMVAFDLLSGVLDGINSQGLMVAVHGNELLITQEGLKPSASKVGVHELQAMRMLLDTCLSVQEARQALEDNRIYYNVVPCIYLICDRAGNSFVFEPCFGKGKPGIKKGAGTPLVLTNHLPDNEPKNRSLMEIGTSTFERWDTLIGELGRKGAPYTIEDIKEINSSVAVSKVISWVPAEHRSEIAASAGLARTLWHAIYDSNSCNLEAKFYVQDRPAPDGGFEEYHTDYFRFMLQ